jgi:hypothetical protein
MNDQDTSDVRGDPVGRDPSPQTDARAEPARPEAGTASGARGEDDRNEETGESPVPDPEATEGDAADDPEAD